MPSMLHAECLFLYLTAPKRFARSLRIVDASQSALTLLLVVVFAVWFTTV